MCPCSDRTRRREELAADAEWIVDDGDGGAFNPMTELTLTHDHRKVILAAWTAARMGRGVALDDRDLVPAADD
jgi:hypothetical protein